MTRGGRAGFRKFRARASVRNVSWGLLDQMLYSATNLLTVLIVARYATQDDLGRFALVMSAFYLAQGVIRALTGEALVVRERSLPPDQRKDAADRSIGAAAAHAIWIAALLGAVGAAVDGSTGDQFLVLAAVLVGVTIEDACRYACFAALDGRRAFLIDMWWAVTQGVLFVALIATGRTSAAWLLGAWGLSGSVAGAMAIVRWGWRADPRSVRRWSVESRSLAPYFLGESFASTGTTQLRTFTISSVAGVGVVGAMRGANVLMSPLNTLYQGAAGPLVAQLANSAAAGRYRAVLVRSTQLAVVSAGAAIVLGTLIFFLPDAVGRELIGETWPASQKLIPLVTVTLVGSALSLGALVGLRSIGAGRAGLFARVSVGVTLLVLGTAGAAIAGASGAVAGLAVGQILGAMLWWRQFLVAYRPLVGASNRSHREPMDADGAVRGEETDGT